MTVFKVSHAVAFLNQNMEKSIKSVKLNKDSMGTFVRSNAWEVNQNILAHALKNKETLRNDFNDIIKMT